MSQAPLSPEAPGTHGGAPGCGLISQWGEKGEELYASLMLAYSRSRVFPSLFGQLTYWVPLDNVLSKVTWLVPRYEEGTAVRHQEFGYGCVGNVTGRSRVSGQG